MLHIPYFEAGIKNIFQYHLCEMQVAQKSFFS